MGQEKSKERIQCKPFIHRRFVEKGRALRRRIAQQKSKFSSHCHRRDLSQAPDAVTEAENLINITATTTTTTTSSCGDNKDEELEIEKRVKALRMLVPGGEDLEMEKLFEETADYIEALRGQVSVMRAVAGLLDGLARERRMRGG